MTVTATNITPEIGLEISGLAGQELVDPARADECQAALDRHGVVVYREAHISDDDLVAFTNLLGTIVVPRHGAIDGHPEVGVISLDPAVSKLAKFQRSNDFWHIDGCTDTNPQKATFLTALEVADEGGDTEFANTFAAYRALPDDEKERIDGLRVLHTFANAQRMSTPDPSAEEAAAWDQVPTRVHPLVWTRADGRKSLVIGSTAEQVVGWDAGESRALLDRLVEWSTQPRFVLRHRWRQGDLVVWDNTGMLHRSIPYEATSRRLMHRTTLVGEEAVA